MIEINQLLTVVIRSTGERTENLCKGLILKEGINEDNIFVVRESPFSASMRRSFEIGIQKGLPWTLCIDADVLLIEGAIRELVLLTDTVEQDVCEIQGLVLDKFIPVRRPAGNHLYRTDLLAKAISLIPQEGTSLRPETDMLNAMSKAGHYWVQSDILLGIHDFEQYYQDIYRKCFLQAHKHKWILSDIESFWQSMSTDDKDYMVALWGLRSGKIYEGTVLVDKSFLNQEAQDVLNIKGVAEKLPIEKQYTHELIQKKIHIFESSDNYAFLQERIFPSNLWNRTIIAENDKDDSITAKYKKLLFSIGNKIEMLGKKIKAFSIKM